ncbi:hypothetical protein ACFYU9_25040 [Streptomyces sp. NPDC004327]|uniref:hypothetical protein n=1 Tax=Streptomyces sp. NPDC004327 TaxID=3364699 RepID=UPI0036BF1DDA
MVVLTALTACAGPYQYYEGTGLHDATAAEVAGGWENVEGTRVVLRKDGTALLEKLDGQDFDFEDGWRLSGTGTWQLTDDDGGQVVRLAMTTRTRAVTAPSAPGVGDGVRRPLPLPQWIVDESHPTAAVPKTTSVTRAPGRKTGSKRAERSLPDAVNTVSGS